ncbi:MAG TPA: carboxypeptidase-like regulatory domain-containing protein [Solirubrobacterales bacterium]|nr:carboxypeptidase-like regulatory domain-containing protein [Solirubrobacterales bacterium]
MIRPLRNALVLAFAAAALLAATATASASSITLKCGGPGKHNKDSVGSVLCAEKPSKPRMIEGVLRDDSNKPVSGPVTVTLSKWTPQGGYYTVEDFKTVTVHANAAGKFSYPAKTATKLTIKFEAAGAFAQAEVSRELQVSIKKLGGGRVKMTVKGAGKIPLKLYLLDESGYPLPGTKAKKANKAGSAVFSLGSFHGKFTYYVDAGEYGDLFWETRGPTFHI